MIGTLSADVLVIGTGAAGIRAALAVSEAGADVILTAKLIIISALMRKGSRGSHYREDFPATTVPACLPKHI